MTSSTTTIVFTTHSSQSDGYTHDFEAGFGFGGDSQSTTTAYVLAPQVTVISSQSTTLPVTRFASAVGSATAVSFSSNTDDVEDLEYTEDDLLLLPAEEELRDTPSQDLDPSNFEHNEELNRRLETQYGDEAWHKPSMRYLENDPQELLNSASSKKSTAPQQSNAPEVKRAVAPVIEPAPTPTPTPVPPPAVPASTGRQTEESSGVPTKRRHDGPTEENPDVEVLNHHSKDPHLNPDAGEEALRLARADTRANRLSDIGTRGHIGLAPLLTGGTVLRGSDGFGASSTSVVSTASSPHTQALFALRLSAQVLGTPSKRASREASSQDDAPVDTSDTLRAAEQFKTQLVAHHAATVRVEQQHAVRASHVALDAMGLNGLAVSHQASVSPVSRSESTRLAQQQLNLCSESAGETSHRERTGRATVPHTSTDDARDSVALLETHNDSDRGFSLGLDSSPDTMPFESSLFLGNDHSGSTEEEAEISSCAYTPAPLGVLSLANLLNPQTVAEHVSTSPGLQSALSILAGAAYSRPSTSSDSRAARDATSGITTIIAALGKIAAPNRGGNMSDESSGGSQHSEDDTRSESVDAFNAFSA